MLVHLYLKRYFSSSSEILYEKTMIKIDFALYFKIFFPADNDSGFIHSYFLLFASPNLHCNILGVAHQETRLH